MEDVPVLIEHFIGQFMRIMPDSDFQGFSEEAVGCLITYDWPGNVRELRNTVEYVMNIVRGRKATLNDLPPTIRGKTKTQPLCEPPGTTVLPLAEIEKHQILLALETFGESTEGKRTAAHHLGISLSTLYRKISRSISI
jgi:transcriptional regulator with PAS, ATPase and Fis domain